MSEFVVWWPRLTWSGRVSWWWVPLRSRFVRPAAERERCLVGFHVHDRVHCPRRCVPGEFTCSRHASGEVV